MIPKVKTWRVRWHKDGKVVHETHTRAPTKTLARLGLVNGGGTLPPVEVWRTADKVTYHPIRKI